MTRFISYIRVSTGRQGASGLGLEAQRQAVRSHLLSVGGSLIAEFVEIESGSKAARPILSEALVRCRRDGAMLVIAKLDRLARNVAFVSALMESGTEFVAVDCPFANRLMLHIMAAFAEFEREQISARTKTALSAAKARGTRLGAHGAVLAEKRKSEAIAFAEGLRPVVEPWVGQPLQSLCEELNRAEILTRSGCQWTPAVVRRVLIRLGLHPA